MEMLVNCEMTAASEDVISLSVRSCLSHRQSSTFNEMWEGSIKNLDCLHGHIRFSPLFHALLSTFLFALCECCDSVERQEPKMAPSSDADIPPAAPVNPGQPCNNNFIVSTLIRRT